jgi:hypothetical protein
MKFDRVSGSSRTHLATLDWSSGFVLSGDDQLIVQPLMISLSVIMGNVFVNGYPHECSPKKIIRSKHSSLIDRTKRSAKALACAVNCTYEAQCETTFSDNPSVSPAVPARV